MNKLARILTVTSLFTASAAQAFEPTVQLTAAGSLHDCTKIQSDSERLHCFDAFALTQNTNDLPQSSKQSKIAVPVGAATAQFGKTKQVDTINTITANITKQSKSVRGLYIWTLDNGQVWRQSESAYFRVDTSKPITIDRGALSAFWLSQAGNNRRLKVKRSH